MAEDSKDTIYIDVDDEITNVIDKVAASNKKLVALVLPKRPSVFQSIVNMKLLKRKSDEANKNLVLVTAEAGILPLAGAVGIHVAKTLSSKPEIPAAPIIAQDMVEAAEDEAIPEIPEEEPDEMKEEALDELKKGAEKSKPKVSKEPDTIELDNTEGDEEAIDTAMPAAAIATAEAKKKSKKKDKKLKVPNFNRFRLIALVGGSALIILVVLWILIFKVWPHATINITTNAQNVNANLTFNLDTNSTSFNKNSNSVPAKVVSESKTYTATVNATGQQNNGQKASGQVSFSAGSCGSTYPSDVPAGTGITYNNLTYITQQNATFTTSGPPHCTFESNEVGITAQSGGSNYNTSGNVTFSVPGQSGESASGSATGGTDDVVTIVSAADVSNAENKIATNSSGAKSDLTSQLNQANFTPINATFSSGSPNTSTNATAGTAASSVTATETLKYTMYGVVESDLNQLLNSNIKSQVNGNQSILNNGLSTASYSVNSSPTNITLIATAVVGPDINVANLKKEIVGQKVATIKSIVQSNPDVSSVSVKISPFYVSKAPGVSKITINIAKPTNSPSNANNN